MANNNNSNKIPSLIDGASRINIIYALVAVNIAVYLWINYLQGVNGGNIGCFAGLQAESVLTDKEYWRVVSSIFVHYDFFHLAFNMAALFIFGIYSKEVFGWLGTFVIYMTCGIVANMVALSTVDPANLQSYCAIGASGAVLGLAAAIAVIMWQLWKRKRNLVAFAFARQFAVILLLQFLIDIFAPNVSQVHHLSGAFTGVVFAIFLMLFPGVWDILDQGAIKNHGKAESNSKSASKPKRKTSATSRAKTTSTSKTRVKSKK